MIAFDTADFPVGQRAELMSDVLLAATQSTTLVHEDDRASAYLRQHTWQLGAVELQHVECSSVRLLRTQRQADAHDERVVALGLLFSGGGSHHQAGVTVPLGRDRLYSVELGRPYEHVTTGPVSTGTIKIPAVHLDLPERVVVRALAGLMTSPMRAIFDRHLRSLTRHATEIERDGSARIVGEATIQLTRALLVSAAGDEARLATAWDDTLLLRIKDFVRAHLHDPQLTPAAVAAALHISQRHLYRVCAAAGLRLEPWIIQQRLAGARDELARPGSQRATIAVVARQWGFANASHFTHRFRTAYGVTPREWQAVSAGRR